jgi:hypothetical protein
MPVAMKVTLSERSVALAVLRSQAAPTTQPPTGCSLDQCILAAMVWGRHSRLPINRLHDALTRFAPTIGMAIQRDKHPPTDHDPDGIGVLNIYDIALRFLHQRATTTQQLPELYNTSIASFLAPLPTAAHDEALSIIAGDAPRSFPACDAPHSSDDICLHPVTHAQAHTYDNKAHIICVVPATTAAKKPQMPTPAPKCQ